MKKQTLHGLKIWLMTQAISAIVLGVIFKANHMAYGHTIDPQNLVNIVCISAVMGMVLTVAAQQKELLNQHRA